MGLCEKYFSAQPHLSIKTIENGKWKIENGKW